MPFEAELHPSLPIITNGFDVILQGLSQVQQKHPKQLDSRQFEILKLRKQALMRQYIAIAHRKHLDQKALLAYIRKDLRKRLRPGGRFLSSTR